MSIWTAGNGIWQVATNWSDGVPNSATADAEFTAANPGNLDIAFNAGTVTVSTLLVNVTGGGAVRFGAGGSAATLVFDGNRVFSPVIDIDSNGSAGISQITGQISIQLASNTAVITRDSDTAFHILGVISGTGSLTKSGDGDLTLSGDNTFTGGLILAAGRVVLASGVEGVGAGTITFRGGELSANGTGTIGNAMIVQSGFSGALNAANAATVTLDIASFSNQGGANSLFTFGTPSRAGTITLAADSVTNLAGASYAIDAGTVRFGNAYSAANFFRVPGDGLVSLNAAATLNTAGFAAVIDNLDLNGGAIRSGVGVLNLAILRTGAADGMTASVTGTAGADYLAFHILDDASSHLISLADLSFASWTEGSDIIGVIGSSLVDSIAGSSRIDTIIAGAGNDLVNGGGGSDALFGEVGDDFIDGSSGIDYIVGGSGNDELLGDVDPDEIYGEAGDDLLEGGVSFHTDILVGGDGNDTIGGASLLGDFDFLYGNLGNDVFLVDTPADLVFEQAGEGTDIVIASIVGAGFYLYDNIENLTLQGDTPFGVGNGLANVLSGSNLANYLLGGGGNDALNGNGGNDVLFGEAGNDSFVFNLGTGTDIIGDFQLGADKIRLLAGLGTALDSFAEIQPFFTQVGNDGAIQLPGGETIIIHSIDMAQLTATDFIFG
jgi:autotransporter-associated beta strand protein